MKTPPQKILFIGNAAGGKTRLARRFSEIYKLPITHVDSIQFVPGLNIRALDETRKILAEITSHPQWIIDGHGPLDQLEGRFAIADQIVYVDLPLWRHYWWLIKRQIGNLWAPRPELPEGCNELSFKHTVKLVKTMWKMHHQMRPELIRILERPQLKNKVLWIRSYATWKQIYETGHFTSQA